MKNILTYSEFIKEDYRDVGYGSGSGGIHQDDRMPTKIASGKYGGSNILSITPVGSDYSKPDKEVLGTEEIKVEDPYFAQKKEKKEKNPDKKKINKIRKKLSKKFKDIDIKASNLSIKK